MMRSSLVGLLVTATLLSGCVGERAHLPEGSSAYAIMPAPAGYGALQSYKIGPFDTIAITVFQEEDLSVKDVQVDAAGYILLPLIGQVAAAGHTSTELADLIASKLQQRFLENPQVSVTVQESVSQKVTVQGSVGEPGVYEIRGRTTLMDAIAMAKGTSRVAALSEVVIFREINGQRTGALFNIKKISLGQADDPEILGSDVVVVGLSNVKAAWRDLLTASPLISVFRPLY